MYYMFNSSPFDKFMGLHTRNSKSEKPLRRTPNDSEVL